MSYKHISTITFRQIAVDWIASTQPQYFQEHWDRFFPVTLNNKIRSDLFHDFLRYKYEKLFEAIQNDI